MIALGSDLSKLIRTPYLLYFNEPAGPAHHRDLRVKVIGVKPQPTLVYGGSVRYPVYVQADGGGR
jgi:hypothetical protein